MKWSIRHYIPNSSFAQGMESWAGYHLMFDAELFITSLSFKSKKLKAKISRQMTEARGA